MTRSRSVVVVLGVHRSGTSLAARVLNTLGVRFGNNLIPGRPDNPLGFWEHSEIVQQSKSIEAKLGIDPFKDGLVVPPQSDWWNDENIAPERKALTKILEREVSAAQSVFGFKDPRTLILLPLWQRIFEDANITPQYVLALRQPGDAIASMMRRGISASAAETIWLSHFSEGLRFIDRAPQVIISYERWFEDPERQALEIATALGLPESSETAVGLGNVIRSELRNFSGEQASFLSSMTVELHASASACTNESLDAVRELAKKSSDAVRLPVELLADLRREPGNSRAKFEEKQKALPREIDLFQREQAKRGSILERGLAGPKKVGDIGFPGILSLLPIPQRKVRPLKVCIATEDIVGPVRNGGIGTTYTHLSFLLAKAGHQVTIAYLRGSQCADHSIDYWIDWYRERGVKFVPVDPPQDVVSPANRWLAPMVALYEYLRGGNFDLVHVSEWRGSAYYSLLAKRQGLAFRDTVFCVKSSSPYLWNRQYMLGPVDDLSHLMKIFAERRSIELADMVVGGSTHLLNWMVQNGYQLPQGRTFVQPNVMVPANIDPELLENRPKAGARTPINEIVFFGRLEGRKGLEVFCDAIRKLVLRGTRVPKITFLGKFGSRIATHPELTVRDYIRAQASSWGVEWKIIDNYGQSEALTYLLGEGRLAVMPSLIENSSLTIYEATNLRVPFIASNTGGNPELVAGAHRKEVLVAPHPAPLSRKLAEAIEKGGFVAAASFDNGKNLTTWEGFHDTLSTIIDEAKEEDTKTLEKFPENEATYMLIKHLKETGRQRTPTTTAVCLVLCDDNDAVEVGLSSLMGQTETPYQVILVDDGSERLTAQRWLEGQRELFEKKGWHIDTRSHYGMGGARNHAARQAKSTHLLFVEPGTVLKPHALATLNLAASCSGADVLISFYEDLDRRNGSAAKERRVIAIPGDPCYPFFDINAGWSPLVLVRKDAFDMLGGFTTDYKVAGDVEEFIMSAVTAGLTVEIVPEVLATHDASIRRAERLNVTGGLFRSIRPHLSAVPTELQALLLASRSLSLRVSGTPEVRGRSVLELWFLRRLPFFASLGRRLPERARRHIVYALRSRAVRPPISPAGDT